MNTHAAGLRKDRGGSLADAVARQRRVRTLANRSLDAGPAAQRALQEAANSGPQVRRLREYQQIAGGNPLARQTAQLREVVNGGTGVVQRDEWESEHFKNVGFKFGDLGRAARKQHTPETCWAAALATGAALLGNDEWSNELKWYQTARRAGLLREGTTRILENELKELVNGVGGFSLTLYTAMGVAAVVGSTLRENKVILLMSDQHVVILGQLQLDKATGDISHYFVIDSASGEVEDWSQEQFNEFQPAYAAVMT